jgi:hypothetical protein
MGYLVESITMRPVMDRICLGCQLYRAIHTASPKHLGDLCPGTLQTQQVILSEHAQITSFMAEQLG